MKSSLLQNADDVVRDTVRTLQTIGLPKSQIRTMFERSLQLRGEKAFAKVRHEQPLDETLNVLTRWANDPDYCDSRGIPIDLPANGRKPSFSSLVADVSKKLDAPTALSRLRSGKSVIVLRTGRIRRLRPDVCELGGKNSALSISLLLDNWRAFLAAQIGPLTNQALPRGPWSYWVSGYTVPKKKLSRFQHLFRAIAPHLEELDGWLYDNRVSTQLTSNKNRIGNCRPTVGVFLDPGLDALSNKRAISSNRRYTRDRKV
jgi:hypothetical protein